MKLLRLRATSCERLGESRTPFRHSGKRAAFIRNLQAVSEEQTVKDKSSCELRVTSCEQEQEQEQKQKQKQKQKRRADSEQVEQNQTLKG
jgi:hypothetical protein